MGDVTCIICERSDKVVSTADRFGGIIYECQRCNFQFLFPQPGDERLTEIYSKEYFHTWGIEDHEGNVRRQKKKTFSMRFRLLKDKLKKGDKVLDCGCATGYLLEVAEENGYQPFGVDLSAFAASESIRKFGNNKIYCGQLEDASFADNPTGKFEAVFMMDYIEHVRNPKKILLLASKLLGENGQIILSTPKLNSLSHRLMGRKWSHYKEEHLYYFSFHAMKKILGDTGFTDVREYPAYKYLSLDYIKGHFETYRHPFFTPLINFVWKLTPAGISRIPFPVMLGDLVVVATKK
jgi:SAM-dependent methyltransferase